LSPEFGSASPTGWASFTIPRNPRYTVTREETLESFVTSYNNYYEFGLTKDIVEEANKHADFLAPESWYIDISGLVENPMTLDVAALISQIQLEERLYRHRCVEAWSITAPWVGFPLSKVLDMVKPQPNATLVQFVSWKNLTVSEVQATKSYPWPYTEALTIEEAKNELTMLTVGAFGKPLTPQQGAPIRLTVPWKYGFKSIKSIEQITFRADSEGNRRTFWSEANSAEYGFYANVNPEVPHRRWSQATERHYVEGFPATRLDTTRMNGYEAQVDYLYSDLEDTNIYF
jgi:methionine sulfoxide reductase catalytic subunit